MTARWANTGLDGPDVLQLVQRSLSVDMVMTPRSDLLTCRRDETVRQVMTRNRGPFSFLPVVDGSDRILGLYRAERWFDRNAPTDTIGDDFEPFSEDIVIGADASIVDFVTTADARQTRLVVSGDRIAGLVSLSDLQRLPVRAALFALITRLEMTMARRIETEWKANDASGWLEQLSSTRRSRVVEAIDKARREDNLVNEIAFSQLSDKATILRRKGLISGGTRSLERDFKAIRKLRDGLAHSNYYAGSPVEARKTCETVRAILRIELELASAMVDPANQA